MTDAELIRKLTEKNFELEEDVKNQAETIAELIADVEELTLEKNNAEIRELDFARKIRNIEKEVNEYQFDSVTNLQNKIKTILMSSTSENIKTD